MEELHELKSRMEQERPARWEELPDLALYMDQIVSYMPRQLIHFDQGETLTSAMVNNYIKDGLLPRAEGKRYGKTHLAYLTAICALKQVISVKDAGLLASDHADGQTGEMYGRFLKQLDLALKDTAGRLDTDCTEEDLPGLALSLALQSYADRLACQRVIDLIRQNQSAAPDKSKKGRKEPKHE